MPALSGEKRRMHWFSRLAALALVAGSSAGSAEETVSVPGLVPAQLAGAHDLLAEDYSRGGVLDEVRFGGFRSIQDSSPDGPLIGGQVLFDPLGPAREDYFLNSFLRPRIHVGGLVATDSRTEQLFAGFTWNFPLGRTFFLEAALGGTIHDGGSDDEGLGCSIAFREGAGVGANLGRHWRAIVSVDHSSNANVCDGNGGLTHAGVSVGYTF
jgi:hypothetical protein